MTYNVTRELQKTGEFTSSRKANQEARRRLGLDLASLESNMKATLDKAFFVQSSQAYVKEYGDMRSGKVRKAELEPNPTVAAQKRLVQLAFAAPALFEFTRTTTKKQFKAKFKAYCLKLYENFVRFDLDTIDIVWEYLRSAGLVFGHRFRHMRTDQDNGTIGALSDGKDSGALEYALRDKELAEELANPNKYYSITIIEKDRHRTFIKFEPRPEIRHLSPSMFAYLAELDE